MLLLSGGGDKCPKVEGALRHAFNAHAVTVGPVKTRSKLAKREYSCADLGIPYGKLHVIRG